jgi:DNA gyrase/topoisomerase IV subunit A
MADQVYNLTQTGAQVQAIINDANKVMGAGSQSTLTTDSILLKDTSGNYHKIDKSSFTEAVRNTMASMLVNNDKGTTISQIAAIASGDFGSVTPANLASVLGEASGMYIGYLDNLTEPGVYNIGSSTQGDKPFPYCTVVVYKRALVITQIAYSSTSVEMKLRIYESNAGKWLDWRAVAFEM